MHEGFARLMADPAAWQDYLDEATWWEWGGGNRSKDIIDR